MESLEKSSADWRLELLEEIQFLLKGIERTNGLIRQHELSGAEAEDAAVWSLRKFKKQLTKQLLDLLDEFKLDIKLAEPQAA